MLQYIYMVVMYREFLASVSLVGITVFLGVSLLSPTAKADGVITPVNINIPISCTLGGIGMTSHNAEIINGNYEANIGTTTFKATCNDDAGFAIYAIGYTDNEYGKTVLTDSSLGSTFDIVTGTNTTTGNPDVSNWAMKLTATTNPTPTYPIIITGSSADTLKQTGDIDYSNYAAVPEEYEKVAYRTTGTDIGQPAEGTTLTATYAAYISRSQPAGTYTGQVKYTMVHPNTHYAPVVYNKNADSISEVIYLQEFAAVGDVNRQSIIDSMVEDTQYTITDGRDNKTYTIAKLADGNVWMTKNLDLDIDSSYRYTNEDTDIGYNTETGEYETASWTPTRSTYATTNTQTHAWCSDNGSICNSPESYDPGDIYWNGVQSNYSTWETYQNSCDFSLSEPSCDVSILNTYISSTSSIPQYHLGNYYNWAAALASNDSSVYDNLDLVEQSICPAGWTLPRVGTGDDSFYNLWSQYGFESYPTDWGNSHLWGAPLYFNIGGSFDGILDSVGFSGVFASPVAYEPSHPWHAHFAYTADFTTNNLYPSDDVYRHYGLSIRCIARPVSNSITID